MMDRDKLIEELVVTYVPKHAKSDYKRRELGRVTSWNDKYVFVDYGTGNSKATRLEDLEEGNQIFYCPDEWNSVTDGAFGRCSTRCPNCIREEETMMKMFNLKCYVLV